MTLTMRQRIARIGAATAIAAVSLIGAAPAANAAVIGDGVTAPSHDSSLAVIPLCKGPVAVGEWLNANFSDHGRDIQNFLATNSKALTALATGNSNIFTAPALMASVILQLPVYTYNDAMFHLPPTTLSLVTGCGVISKTGINPFNILL